MAHAGSSTSSAGAGNRHVDEMLEHLLEDELFKDTTIELADGTLQAHASILAAASDAVRGMLSNGSATVRRTLSWKEHDLRTGQFFLRFLYTGYADVEDWKSNENDTVETEQPPLHLLLGSLGIADAFQFSAVLDRLIFSLKRRLNAASFNDICKAAIKNDVQSLRTHCLLMAASGSTCSGPWFPGKYKVISETVSVTANFTFDSDEPDTGFHTAGEVLEVLEVYGHRGRLEWPVKGWVSIISSIRARSGKKLLEFCDAAKIKEDYVAGRLSPEVCYELRGLYEDIHHAKRQRIIV